MFGDTSDVYAKWLGCFNSYHAVSSEEEPPIAIGTTVRILKGDHHERLGMYVGCLAVVIEHSKDNPPLYKLRETTTRAEICWFANEHLMPTKSWEC